MEGTLVKELHIKAIELLKRGENFIIATILNKSGSMPRDTGAKMLVLADRWFNCWYYRWRAARI